jgi:hypothetical protein
VSFLKMTRDGEVPPSALGPQVQAAAARCRRCEVLFSSLVYESGGSASVEVSEVSEILRIGIQIQIGRRLLAGPILSRQNTVPAQVKADRSNHAEREATSKRRR